MRGLLVIGHRLQYRYELKSQDVECTYENDKQASLTRLNSHVQYDLKRVITI